MDGQLPDDVDRELSDVERALLSLAPRRATIDRDRVLLEARKSRLSLGESGASVAQRQATMRTGMRRWLWPAATFVSTAAACVLAVIVLTRDDPQPRIVEKTIYVNQRATTPTPTIPRQVEAVPVRDDEPRDEGDPLDSPDFVSYVDLRDRVISIGLNALPSPVTSGSAGGVANSPRRRNALPTVSRGVATDESTQQSSPFRSFLGLGGL